MMQEETSKGKLLVSKWLGQNIVIEAQSDSPNLTILKRINQSRYIGIYLRNFTK